MTTGRSERMKRSIDFFVDFDFEKFGSFWLFWQFEDEMRLFKIRRWACVDKKFSLREALSVDRTSDEQSHRTLKITKFGEETNYNYTNQNFFLFRHRA